MVDGYETMFNELKQENQKLKEALDVAVDCLDDISDSSNSSITRRSARQALDKIKALVYRDWETDRKSTRLNSSHITRSRMPSSA